MADLKGAANVAGGSAVGAGLGAAIGSIVPGAGTGIGALIGSGIGSSIGSLVSAFESSDAAASIDEQTKQQVSDAIKIFEQNQKLPQYDQTPLTYQQYTLLNKYTPKVAQYIQEKSPEMVTENTSQDVINKQKDALQQYQQLSQTGEDAIGKAQREQALNEASGIQQKNTSAILKQYQNQGVGQGGQAILAQQNAGQQADTARRQNSLDVASQNQQRRLAALGQLTNLAGDIRNQNAKTEDANVNAINAFNQRNSQTKQAYENQQANLANEAQQYNINAAQNVANANIQNANNTAQYNKNRADTMTNNITNTQNSQNTARLNAATGQAAQNQAIGEAAIGRNNAIINQIAGTVGNVANTGINYMQKSADKSTTPPELDPLKDQYSNTYYNNRQSNI